MGLKKWYLDKTFGLRKGIARRSLNKQLAGIIETANGHQNMGVTAGAETYHKLALKAKDAIDAFSSEYKTDREEILLATPGLVGLNNLCQERPGGKRSQLVGWLVAVFIIGCGLAAMAAIWVRIFHGLAG